jgi:hypothetical protein
MGHGRENYFASGVSGLVGMGGVSGVDRVGGVRGPAPGTHPSKTAKGGATMCKLVGGRVGQPPNSSLLGGWEPTRLSNQPKESIQTPDSGRCIRSHTLEPAQLMMDRITNDPKNQGCVDCFARRPMARSEAYF